MKTYTFSKMPMHPILPYDLSTIERATHRLYPYEKDEINDIGKDLYRCFTKLGYSMDSPRETYKEKLDNRLIHAGVNIESHREHIIMFLEEGGQL